MPASAICAAHGLRFDPKISTGCVLCKRASDVVPTSGAPSTAHARKGPEVVLEDPPSSWKEALLGLLVGQSSWLALLLVGAGLALYGQQLMRGPDAREVDITLGGSLAAKLNAADSAECRTQCAVVSETCSLRCDIADVGCQLKCQRPALACDEACVPRSVAGSPFFRYTRGVAPEWWVSLDRFDRARPEILSRCQLESGDKLHLHFRQLPDGLVQATVDHPDPNKARCAEQLLAPALREPGSKGYALFATLSLGAIDYRLLMEDALETVDSARSPLARARAESEAQAYTARHGRQLQRSSSGSKPQELERAVSALSQEAALLEQQRALQQRQLEQEQHATQIDEQRYLIELRRQQLQRGEKGLTLDDLSNQHLRGHIGHEDESWRREYRRDDRATDRENWRDVERLRRQRENTEQREHWMREQKLRAIERSPKNSRWR